MKSWSWVLLIVFTILIKWASWYPEWVENYYTYGLYPIVSAIQRFLLGWIPFSIGTYSMHSFYSSSYSEHFASSNCFSEKAYAQTFHIGLTAGDILCIVRVCILQFALGHELQSEGDRKPITSRNEGLSLADLDTLNTLLQSRLNHYADFVSEAQRDSFNRKRLLFSESVNAYKEAKKQYSFLSYSPKSVKPSLFSYAGNILGFQGYYNPFSGEAQVNTTIPRFQEPFVTTHEMAHQLGYAKENEANFVAFLACRSYPSTVFRYSLYFDMYSYSIGELYRRDSVRTRALQLTIHPQVKKDVLELRSFYKKYKNPVEPVITWFYGHYLQANNQPSGKQTYNEVVAFLIAYYKKFGKDAL